MALGNNVLQVLLAFTRFGLIAWGQDWWFVGLVTIYCVVASFFSSWWIIACIRVPNKKKETEAALDETREMLRENYSRTRQLVAELSSQKTGQNEKEPSEKAFVQRESHDSVDRAGTPESDFSNNEIGQTSLPKVQLPNGDVAYIISDSRRTAQELLRPSQDNNEVVVLDVENSPTFLHSAWSDFADWHSLLLPYVIITIIYIIEVFYVGRYPLKKFPVAPGIHKHQYVFGIWGCFFPLAASSTVGFFRLFYTEQLEITRKTMAVSILKFFRFL